MNWERSWTNFRVWKKNKANELSVLEPTEQREMEKRKKEGSIS